MTHAAAVGLPALAAVALAALLDAGLAEPPASLHPVAWFGRAVGPLDREWPAPLAVGAVAALAWPLAAAAAVGALVWAAGRVDPWLAAGVAGLALFAATSRRMLLEEARAVVDLSATDLPAARERLLSLAGRDAEDLSAGQVRSAAVESLAENLADGLVAPLAAFAAVAAVTDALAAPLVLAASPPPAAALAAGAAAAAWVKAVNTMDSMLGYRHKRVGAPAARLDDAVMWLPARATALLLAAAAGAPGALGRARSLAGRPASPNSGWPMATAAVALDARLAKPGAYDLDAGGTLPDVPTAERALALTGRAGWLAFAVAALTPAVAAALPGGLAVALQGVAG